MAAILGLAFFMAFIPHRNYAYPVHLDEWQVMVYTNQLMAQGSTAELTDPFYDGAPNINQIGELGTHIFWGIFREVTGFDWLPIFRYFPSVIFMVTVLSVYVLGQRQGFGWQAALFASLLPTTVGLLGPGFLVPLALAMLFIPLALFVAFNLRTWWTYPVLLLLIAGAALAHPPTAAALVVVLAPYILISLLREPKHGLGMALVLAVPFIALFPLVYRLASPMLKTLFVPHPINTNVLLPWTVSGLGYLPVALCLLGVIFLTWKGSRAGYGMVLGTLALLAVLAVYAVFHYGAEFVYFRGIPSAMLMACVLAGAGLMAVMSLRGARRESSPTPRFFTLVGPVAALAVVVATLAVAIPARLSTPYYHMIDREDYRAFTWINASLGSQYDKALLDPWKGIAFVGLAGKKVFSWIGEAPTPRDRQAYEFLAAGAHNNAFLKQNRVSVVYSRSAVTNPRLIEVRRDVYLLTSGRATP